MATRSHVHTGPVLNDATTRAIAGAVFDELAASGYGRLSVDAVARRAGVGKAAIYRRWPSKEEMVLAHVTELATRPDLFPDTGTITGDLRSFMQIATRYLRHPLVARIVPDLLAEAARDSAFGTAMHEQVGIVRRERGADMVRRAIARDELPAAINLPLAADLVAAPVYWRLAVTREPFDEQDLEQLVNVTLAALRAA